jgi:peptidyl-prolyl cis-trans isomerase SurA
LHAWGFKAGLPARAAVGFARDGVPDGGRFLRQTPERRSKLLLFSILAGILAVGCNRQNSDKDVLAKVNGYKITRSEVDKTYNTQTAGAPQKLSQLEDQALRLNILHQLIDLRLKLQKAEKLGIVATDDEVDSKLSQAKAPYTKEEFQKRLQQVGLTEDDYKTEIRHNVTIEKLLNKEVGSKVTITDAEIQNYYNQNRAQFNLVEPQYDVAQIVVTSQAGPQPSPIPDKAQDDAQARKKIQIAYNRLESGEDFATVAGRYSEDLDTRNNGGDLGLTPESQLKNTDNATRDAILKLKPEQYSGIIRVVNPQNNQFVGYRIVQLKAKRAAGQREFNDPEVQQFIRNQLRSQREQILRNAYDEVLHDGADVRNYYAEEILKENGQK